MMRFTRITVKLGQMEGVLCIRGFYILVATVIGMVAEGMGKKEILEAHPDLKPNDIQESLYIAAEAVANEICL